MSRKTKAKKRVTCTHCQWIWNTASKHAYVTCPSCLRKTLNKPTPSIPLTPEAQLARKTIRHS